MRVTAITAIAAVFIALGAPAPLAGSDYGDCRDAIEQAESAASELEDAASDLESCASSRDFNNDCSSEASQASAAASDYENAVSEINWSCT